MEEIKMIKISKAISDPVRLKIIILLVNRGTMCACKLLDELVISQGTLSHHMKILAEAELIDVRKDGKWRHYHLNSQSLMNYAGACLDLSKSASLDDDSPCSCKQ